jgi:NADPH-dependent FMN reductase
MKLLGLTCGTEMGNAEVLVREALLAAEEAGVEVALIRLLDLDLKPCTGCKSCIESLMKGGAGNCIIKDDFPFLDEQIMQSDGVILGSPVFVLGAHGIVKPLADRMGPGHDLAWRIEARDIREESGRTEGKGPDFSYQVIQEPIGLPGVWPPGASPPPGSYHPAWDRVSELWYETFSDWRRSVIESPPQYTRPSWATSDTYPFVKPFEGLVSSFLLERPNDEFLRDLRAYTP